MSAAAYRTIAHASGEHGPDLNDSDESTIVNALILAASEYDRLAETHAKTYDTDARAFGRIAEQFRRQATEARALADRIQDLGLSFATKAA